VHDVSLVTSMFVPALIAQGGWRRRTVAPPAAAPSAASPAATQHPQVRSHATAQTCAHMLAAQAHHEASSPSQVHVVAPPRSRSIRKCVRMSPAHPAGHLTAGHGTAGTPRGTPRGGGGGRKQRPDAVPLERQLRRGLTALARAVALEALGLSASVAGGAQTVLQVSCFPGAQLTLEAERPFQASAV
jgi:hypothetical protein